MVKSHLKLVTPRTVFGPVTCGNPPRKRRNAELRAREYLTSTEVEKLIAATGDNRHGHRDATMVLIAFRHGLRSAELVALRWDSVDFDRSQIHVARVKGSAASVHPLTGRELRVLRRLHREQSPKSSFVFTSERGAPFATGGFRTLIARLGKVAGYRISRSSAHAATRLRIQACQRRNRYAESFRPISGIATSSTPCATPSFRRHASRTSGGLTKPRYLSLRPGPLAHAGSASPAEAPWPMVQPAAASSI